MWRTNSDHTLFLQDADDHICKALKAKGRLLQKGTYQHSYPFCWRSDTPLMNRTVPSWYVRVEKIKERIVAHNKKTYWVPDFVGERRFHNWLEGARDWAISRSRYWGTPLPIWCSEDFEEIVVVGSIAELEKLSGEKVVDLHRDSIDHITIPSQKGKGPLKRVPEVFDCWFESGSMPYAQSHYPFKDKETWEKQFPADFIAEGLDQTRGWFYTLMVLSTALFDKPAFKNVVVNGLVKAADGKKMSKRLQNYPDPLDVISRYGSDSLRLYLISSPVVRGQELLFKEEGVFGITRDVMLKWYSTFRFYSQNMLRYERRTGTTFTPALSVKSGNITDQWVLSSIQTLNKYVRQEMDKYRLYNVIPRLLNFIEDLTNWYVKLNRARMKGLGTTTEDCKTSLGVLYDVLFQLSILMAPCTPFFAEYLYQQLRPLHPNYNSTTVAADAPGRADSVHYVMIPEPNEDLVDLAVERKIQAMRTALTMGRTIRERERISFKYPVRSLVIVNTNTQFLEDVKELEDYIKDEIQCDKIVLERDERNWCQRVAKLNFRKLGRRLKKKIGAVKKAVQELNHDQVKEYMITGTATVLEEVLTGDDIHTELIPKCDESRFKSVTDPSNTAMAAMEIVQDARSVGVGVVRELISRVQKMRKTLGLVLTDKVEVFYKVNSDKLSSTFLDNAITANRDTIGAKLGGQTLLPHTQLPATAVVQLVNSDPIKPLQGVVGAPAEIAIDLTLISMEAVLDAKPALAACGGNTDVFAHLQEYVQTVAKTLGQHATYSVVLMVSVEP